MSQGKRKEAWVVMAKLVPNAVYRDTENNDHQDVDIQKVGCLNLNS